MKTETAVHVVHDANDRAMTSLVMEIAKLPPSLDRYKRICDAAYTGVRNALRNFEQCPYFICRAWVRGLAYLLRVQPMDDESAEFNLGFTLEDAKFIEKCLSPLIPLLSTHDRKRHQLGLFVPNCMTAMYFGITGFLEECREQGRRFSLFDAVFSESELMPGRYMYKPLGVDVREPIPLLSPSIASVDEFLDREDGEIEDFIAAVARDDERYNAKKQELDAYNDSLGLEQISVKRIMDFIESYGGDAPMKPTPKVVRDLTAIFRFNPCEGYESETSSHHYSICETHYYRYSLDGKNIGDEISTIQDAVDCFMRDQVALAERVEEANRIEAICERCMEHRYSVFPDDVIESIIGEFKRVYDLKSRPTATKASAPRARRGIGGKGLKTEFMKRQLSSFMRFLGKVRYDGDESRLYALANQCWNAKKAKWDKAKLAEGQNKGYSSSKVLADAYKKSIL